MPFTAPSSGHYVDNQGNPVPGATYTNPDGTLGWSSWDSGDGTPLRPVGPGGLTGPGANPDDALLAKLNRPAGTKIVGSRPITEKDKNGKEVPTGNLSLSIVGPDGQPDDVVVDSKGDVVAGAQKTPTKEPTPANPHPNAAPGTGVWDQTLNEGKGGYSVPIPATVPGRQVDTPAQTQTAATGAAAQTESARHNAATEADATRLQDLNAKNQTATNQLVQAKLEWDQKSKQLDQDLANNRLTFEQWQSQWQSAHAQAQDANAAATEANNKFVAEQNAQYQRAQIADAQTKNAETSRANQANEADKAAQLQQKAQADQQASTDRAHAEGAQLLRDHATASTNLLNNWTSMAGGNKNFGVGGAIPGDLGANLMSDANSQATAAMGGQSVMDQATAMVHQANPALAATPQGAAYTAVAAQMLDQQTQAKMQAPGTQSQPQDTGTGSGQPEGSARQDFAPSGDTGTGSGQPEGTNRQVAQPQSQPLPMDPASIGTAVGAAIQHIGGFTAPGRPQ